MKGYIRKLLRISMKPDKTIRPSSTERQMIIALQCKSRQSHAHNTGAQLQLTIQCMSYRGKLIMHLHVKPTL